ncbi:D-Ala-D-Ala carboxypeptidase family metallohydrolase [uncultured Roseobacter sp.]|uniref:D-Ala-D-Ala carboxypeptidase family metallohydrolase n=1 Tax=uncultured Roseobacter sp. TaxID=114847 RepID=UPI0026235110|nr:D-Ala-D-Ala carboxypeptidase family metallohydrolase [uncultured Roseobacter sp.]
MTTDQTEGGERDIVPAELLDSVLGQSFSRADTPEMVAFREFFAEQSARHFSADEFMVLGPSHHVPGGACEGKNALAPSSLWNNVVPLIAAMDAIRDELGEPVRITNCYRSSDYNSCVGGVSNSYHKTFKAADWVCGTGTSADWAAAAARVRDRGAFTGGIGIYETFVHVDVRGQSIDWDNR